MRLLITLIGLVVGVSFPVGSNAGEEIPIVPDSIRFEYCNLPIAREMTVEFSVSPCGHSMSLNEVRVTVDGTVARKRISEAGSFEPSFSTLELFYEKTHQDELYLYVRLVGVLVTVESTREMLLDMVISEGKVTEFGFYPNERIENEEIIKIP